jgi:hypothetical protein
MNYKHLPDTRTPFTAALLMCSVILCLVRKRTRAQDAAPPRKRQRNNCNRAKRRSGLIEEILQLPDPFFKRMFRMPKTEFLWLVERVTPMLRAGWTSKSVRMAIIGSGGEVSTFLLVAATIRWLAGGSIYDIAFMLKISDKTIHHTKYNVIRAICQVLSGNVTSCTRAQHGYVLP